MKLLAYILHYNEAVVAALLRYTESIASAVFLQAYWLQVQAMEDLLQASLPIFDATSWFVSDALMATVSTTNIVVLVMSYWMFAGLETVFELTTTFSTWTLTTLTDAVTVLGGIVAYFLVARYYPEQESIASTVIQMLTVLWLHVRDSDS